MNPVYGGQRFARSIFLLDIFHAFEVFEVFILCPEDGVMGAGRGKNQAIRHGEFEFSRESGGAQCQRFINLDDLPMFHIADVNLRLMLPLLLEHLFEDFVNTDDRYKQIRGVFDGGGEKNRRCCLLRSIPASLKSQRCSYAVLFVALDACVHAFQRPARLFNGADGDKYHHIVVSNDVHFLPGLEAHSLAHFQES
jgi:hypothetical protein